MAKCWCCEKDTMQPAPELGQDWLKCSCGATSRRTEPHKSVRIKEKAGSIIPIKYESLPNPYYQDDWVTIYHGDCRDILPLILDKSIDLVLTSSPYNVGLDYRSELVNDKLPIGEFQVWVRQWLIMCFNIMAEPSRAYFVVGDKMKWWFKPLCEELGYKYHESLVWCKPNLVGNSAGKISGDWNIMTEDILLFHKGKRTPMLKGKREMSTWNWFVETTPQTNFKENYRYHPAQFPTNMILRIIGRTPGDLILDPFLGSGTTAFGAKKLNRKCIGIEIEEKYCEIAAKRCSQEVFNLDIRRSS